MKFCIRCKQSKPLLDFHKAKKNKDGHYTYCKICTRNHNQQLYPRYKEKKKLRSQQVRRLNPERTALYDQKRNLRRKFNMSVDDYNLILSLQDGKCKICDKRPSTRKLAVDHNHQTNFIRGLLCSRCNVVLGLCDENIDIFRNAIHYLLAERT